MHFDNSRALAELGLKPRPLRETLADAIAWFHTERLLKQGGAGGQPAGAAAGD